MPIFVTLAGCMECPSLSMDAMDWSRRDILVRSVEPQAVQQ
ncbi:hypothetical protein ACP70R_003997 [Stipagrostis hirtigluma subsp. patula]